MFPLTVQAFVSLIVEVTEAPAEYFKYLSNAQKYGDHGEGVHGAEEDGFLKVFWYHAFSHIEGLFQRAGIAYVQGMNLRERKKVSSWNIFKPLQLGPLTSVELC